MVWNSLRQFSPFSLIVNRVTCFFTVLFALPSSLGPNRLTNEVFLSRTPGRHLASNKCTSHIGDRRSWRPLQPLGGPSRGVPMYYNIFFQGGPQEIQQNRVVPQPKAYFYALMILGPPKYLIYQSYGLLKMTSNLAHTCTVRPENLNE